MDTDAITLSKIERCPPALQQIIEEFREATPRERLEYLLEYAYSLPDLPAALQTQRDQMEQVHECQSPVFLFTEIHDGVVQFYLDIPMESPTVRGYGSILVEGFQNATPAQVLQTPDDVHALLGLPEVITPQRVRGLHALLHYMKKQVLRKSAGVKLRCVQAAYSRWLLTVGLLAIALATIVPCPLHAQAPDAPPAIAAALDEYVAALETAQTLLSTTHDDVSALAAARTLLAPFVAIQLPGDQTVKIQPLLGDPAIPLTRLAAQARIRTVLDQIHRAAGDQTASRLALLDQVWQLPEFTRGETLGERFMRWLAELLDRLFPDWRPNPAAQQATLTATGLTGWVIAGIAVLVLAWLLSLWLRRLLGRFVADAAAEQADNGDDLPRTPAEARARADALARTGAYRDAVRNLYLAALLGLEQRHIVVADRSLTNREVLAQVPADNAIRPFLHPVIDTFDAVWYGVQEPDAATFAGYTTQIDGLELAAEASEEPRSQ